MENTQLPCPLCESPGTLLHSQHERVYYRCSGCFSAFLHPSQRLSLSDEKRRYELHNNDVEDPRYQKFVSPLVELAAGRYGKQHIGLDFGSGQGPVITKLLRERGYDIHPYDPFFQDNIEVLDRTYDYIICCEVIEHFYHPRKSFSLLRSLLKPAGSLFCRTSLFTDDIDFTKWYYKNDETHTFFYNPRSIEWIAAYFGFTRADIIDNSIIEFSLL